MSDDLDRGIIGDALKSTIGDHAAEWLQARLDLLERAMALMELIVESPYFVSLHDGSLRTIEGYDMVSLIAEHRGETPEATLARLGPVPGQRPSLAEYAAMLRSRARQSEPLPPAPVLDEFALAYMATRPSQEPLSRTLEAWKATHPWVDLRVTRSNGMPDQTILEMSSPDPDRRWAGRSTIEARDWLEATTDADRAHLLRSALDSLHAEMLRDTDDHPR